MRRKGSTGLVNTLKESLNETLIIGICRIKRARDTIVRGAAFWDDVVETILDSMRSEGLSFGVFRAKDIATEDERRDVEVHLCQKSGGEIALIHQEVDSSRTTNGATQPKHRDVCHGDFGS